MRSTVYRPHVAHVEQAFERWIPRRIDVPWVARHVDAPRFGWDLAGLQRGFTEPLYRYFDAHRARIRPVLASELIRVLGRDPMHFGCELAALELHHLASIMLDDLSNGKDIADCGGADGFTLPVLVTVAYSARQLAPVLVWRHSGALSPARRRWLGWRFARLLYVQGVGSVLDLRGGETDGAHPNLESLLAHLHWRVAPLTFGLACDVAAAAADLDEARAQPLRAAGEQLGIAYRLAQRARRTPAPYEQPIQWRTLCNGSAALEIAATQALERALSYAAAFDVRVRAALADFYHALIGPRAQEAV